MMEEEEYGSRRTRKDAIMRIKSRCSSGPRSNYESWTVVGMELLAGATEQSRKILLELMLMKERAARCHRVASRAPVSRPGAKSSTSIRICQHDLPVYYNYEGVPL